MASSIASPVDIEDGNRLEGVQNKNRKLKIIEVDKVHKPTAIDKAGGILCHICDTIFEKKKDYDTHYVQHNTGDAEIVYTCVICKKQIPGYPSFRGHCYLNHVVKNKFQCHICFKQFCKLAVLNTHIAQVHDFKCNFCDEKFTSKADFQRHKQLSHTKIKKGVNAPPYNCHICDTTISTLDCCESHIDKHCQMQYPCPICQEICPDKLTCIKHLTKHFNENMPSELTTGQTRSDDSSVDILGGILCFHCDKLFRTRADIDSHFAAEHGDKMIIYSCNVCSKSFDKYSLFGDHCYYHYSRDRFVCDQCNKTFPRLSLLVIHTEVFHTDCTADKTFRCNECNCGFMTCHRLREHRRIVHGEQECLHRCTRPGCNEAFGKPKDLIQHLKVHSPMMDNWCKQCGLQFTTLGSAEKHLDVHRRKNYSCPVCDKQYREKYLIVKHVPVHFETVFHVCKVCGKVYKARNRLIEHAKVHSQTPTHRCTYCEKSFFKPQALAQHLNTHTGTKPYSCTMCPKNFTCYPNWAKHLRRMHSLDTATIRQLNKDRYKSDVPDIVQTSPITAESGIESGGSELSDLYTFPDSDDSSDERSAKHWKVYNLCGDSVLQDNDSAAPEPAHGMSIAETVRACIDRMDSLHENLDEIKHDFEMNSKDDIDIEFGTLGVGLGDDASDIKAIVEHIDALSGEMEAASRADLTDSMADSTPEVLEYTHMMPVDSAMYTTVTEAMQATVSDASYQQTCGFLPEYGPDFTTESSSAADGGLLSIDDHLPHINPLLTIKPEDEPKMYVPNIHNVDFDNVTAPIDYDARIEWPPPIITKLYQYQENNDANRTYVIY